MAQTDSAGVDDPYRTPQPDSIEEKVAAASASSIPRTRLIIGLTILAHGPLLTKWMFARNTFISQVSLIYGSWLIVSALTMLAACVPRFHLFLFEAADSEPAQVLRSIAHLWIGVMLIQTVTFFLF